MQRIDAHFFSQHNIIKMKARAHTRGTITDMLGLFFSVGNELFKGIDGQTGVNDHGKIGIHGNSDRFQITLGIDFVIFIGQR